MRRLVAISASLAALLTAAPAHAGPVTHGTIVVGRGAAGARLDMTRAQVIAKLCAPEDENGNGVLFYEPDSANRIFDVYRDLDPPKHVRMFIIAGFHGQSFKLADGNAIFARRSIARLYKRLRTPCTTYPGDASR